MLFSISRLISILSKWYHGSFIVDVLFMRMTSSFFAFFVDKPENVHLTASISSDNICTGIIVNFTCTAEANPQVHSYALYENDSMIMNMDRSGVWIRPMNTPDLLVYRCEANNSVGTGKSSNTTLTVKGEDT